MNPSQERGPLGRGEEEVGARRGLRDHRAVRPLAVVQGRRGPLLVPLALDGGRVVSDVRGLVREVGVRAALVLGRGAVLEVSSPLPGSGSIGQSRAKFNV